jgi:hypothetical protein
MSGIIVLSTLSIATVAAAIAVVRTTLRDGYRRVPTRSL